MPWNNSTFSDLDWMAFFRDHAETVQWYQAAQCPCMSGTGTDGQPNLNCAACGGLGYWYPNPAQTLAVILTEVKQAFQLTEEGWAMPGTDLIAGFAPAASLPAYGDLIWPTRWRQGEPFEGQRVVRGSGSTDALWYTATTVDYCATVDPTTGLATVYQPGVDFSVSGKTVTWLGTTNQPPAGSLYTIRYNAQFEWVVYQPPQVRLERATSLGPQAILRKRHVVLANLPGVLGG